MLIAFNKPFNVLCQFTDAAHGRANAAGAGRADAASGVPKRRTLAEFGLPSSVYAAGRLDFDSEGLLLLTDDGALAHLLTDPLRKQAKTYWVQVEGTPDAAPLQALREGVELKDGRTRRASVRVLEQPPPLWPRDPPVRFRKTVPDAWLELVISEGRNRQVRRMTAAVGLPTLRLVRVAMGPYALGALAPGQWCALQPQR